MSLGGSCQSPSFPPPSIVITILHPTQVQRADVAALQQSFAGAFSPLPSQTSFIEHRIEMHPGMMLRSWP